MRDLRVACVGLRGGGRGSGRSVAQLLVDGHRGDAVAANSHAGRGAGQLLDSLLQRDVVVSL